MKVNSVTKYKTVKAFTIFKLLFLPGDVIYISSDYRTGSSSADWCACFNAKSEFIGEMNDDYFDELNSRSTPYIKKVDL